MKKVKIANWGELEPEKPTDLNQLCPQDLTTWKRDMAYLSGVAYAGVTPL